MNDSDQELTFGQKVRGFLCLALIAVGLYACIFVLVCVSENAAPRGVLAWVIALPAGPYLMMFAGVASLIGGIRLGRSGTPAA